MELKSRILIYAGPIDNGFISTIMDSVKNIPQGIKVLQINLSSGGGNVTSGVTAYHYLKSLPFLLVTNNIGDVSSASILPYLAGAVRLAETPAKFIFHPFAIEVDAGKLSFPALDEKLKVMETDLLAYASIVEAEAFEFTKVYNMHHLLKYDTVVLSSQDEFSKYGITKDFVSAPDNRGDIS